MDLIGLAVAVLLWGVALWGLYQIGSYEATGLTGWRRIIGGWRICVDQLEGRFLRWAARQRKRPKQDDR